MVQQALMVQVRYFQQLQALVVVQGLIVQVLVDLVDLVVVAELHLHLDLALVVLHHHLAKDLLAVAVLHLVNILAVAVAVHLKLAIQMVVVLAEMVEPHQ